MKSKEEQDAARRRRNAEVLDAMKRGGSLCHTDIGAFRWAPRPIIKKDSKELDRIFSTNKGKSNETD